MIAAVSSLIGDPVLGAVVAQNVFFYLIAAVMVIAALRVVTTSNIIHAALYLVVVLAGVAAQFILLGAEFVGVTQVLVYIGAVIVLFLFGIMLTRAKVGNEDGLNHDSLALPVLTAVLLILVMGYAVVDFAVARPAETVIAGAVVAEPESVAEVLDLAPEIVDELGLVNFRESAEDETSFELNLFVQRNPLAEPNGIPVRGATVVLLDEDGEPVLHDDGETAMEMVTGVDGRYLFEDLPEGDYTIKSGELSKDAKLSSVREIDVLDRNETTVEQVSDSIFSTYIVAFEAISVLLLAALIGAIVVARKE